MGGSLGEAKTETARNGGTGFGATFGSPQGDTAQKSSDQASSCHLGGLPTGGHCPPALGLGPGDTHRAPSGDRHRDPGLRCPHLNTAWRWGGAGPPGPPPHPGPSLRKEQTTPRPSAFFLPLPVIQDPKVTSRGQGLSPSCTGPGTAAWSVGCTLRSVGGLNPAV